MSEDDEILAGYVATALEQLEIGQLPDLDVICVERPHLAPIVAEAIGLRGKVSHLRHEGDSKDPLVGSVLGERYQVGAAIGAGAMGIVYTAGDLELQRPVAIKILRADLLDDGERGARFAREGDVLAAVNHPAIVTIYDRGRTDDGREFLVMELLDGSPLERYLEPLPPIRQLVEWIAALADGLQAAHGEGVFHRDVKPSNVIVRSADSSPVLVDFGIAARAAHATLAQDDRGLGTPAYMAPEQLRPGDRSRPSVDVYGLTATLYHGLTGRSPYDGTPSQVLAAIQREDPVPARKLRPSLPRDLLAILDRGMARDPRDRYASAAELRDDLRAFLNHEPVRARYPGPISRGLRRVRRSPVARAVVSTVLVVGISIAVLGAWDSYSAARAAERRGEWQETWAGVEPFLALWNVRDREFPAGERRDAVRVRLDRAAALCEQPVPTLAVRAAFSFDHGERDAAAADAARIAQELDTPVSRAIAARYADAVATGDAIDVDDVPDPVHAQDAFLLAFHEMRRGNAAGLVKWLENPLLSDFEPAVELRLGVEAGRVPKRGVGRIRKAREVHEEIVRFEERRGVRTSMSAHLIGVALIGQGRYLEAQEAILAGLELSPHSASLAANLGVTCRRLGDLEGAVAALERAIRNRPHIRVARETLLRVHLDRAWIGAVDAVASARRVVAEAPLGEKWASRQTGDIEVNRAMMHLERGQTDEAAEAARLALESWERSNSGDPFEKTLAAGIARGQRPLVEAFQGLTGTPMDWPRLVRAIALIPDTLDESETAALKSLLWSLVAHLAPDIRVEPSNLPVQPSSK